MYSYIIIISMVLVPSFVTDLHIYIIYACRKQKTASKNVMCILHSALPYQSFLARRISLRDLFTESRSASPWQPKYPGITNYFCQEIAKTAYRSVICILLSTLSYQWFLPGDKRVTLSFVYKISAYVTMATMIHKNKKMQHLYWNIDRSFTFQKYINDIEKAQVHYF